MMLNTLKTFNYHKELVLTPLKTTMIASQNILPQKSRQLKKNLIPFKISQLMLQS